MNEYKLFTAFLAVFILLVPTVIAVEGEYSITIGTAATGGATGANTTLKSDGASCSAASECTNGYCVHSICRSASTYCGDGYCDSGESCSSDDSACTSGYACTNGCQLTTVTPTTPGGAVTPTPEEEEEVPTPEKVPPEEKEVTPVEVPVTDTAVIEEVTNVIKPEDLGVTQIDISNVEVKQTGTAEVKTKAGLNTVENALTVATGEAKQTLTEVKTAISAGAATSFTVTNSVQVFEVKEKTTNKTASVSKITISFTADKDLKNVDIVEVIPKSIATSITEVKFLGEQPKILQADPIVQWSFDNVSKGEKKDLSYQVNKKIEMLNTTTVAVAEVEIPPEIPPEVPPEKPGISYLYVVIGLVVLVAIYFVYRRFYPTGKKPFRYSYKPK